MGIMGISIRIYHAGLHQIELEEEKWGGGGEQKGGKQAEEAAGIVNFDSLRVIDLKGNFVGLLADSFLFIYLNP